MRRRGAALAQHLREDRVRAGGRDVGWDHVAVAGRGAKMQMMFLGGPDADGVVTQVVGEHRDGALEVVVRVVSERRETRELVEHEVLPSILLGSLELAGG